jgi:hypothetical protein
MTGDPMQRREFSRNGDCPFQRTHVDSPSCPINDMLLSLSCLPWSALWLGFG